MMTVTVKLKRKKRKRTSRSLRRWNRMMMAVTVRKTGEGRKKKKRLQKKQRRKPKKRGKRQRKRQKKPRKRKRSPRASVKAEVEAGVAVQMMIKLSPVLQSKIRRRRQTMLSLQRSRSARKGRWCWRRRGEGMKENLASVQAQAGVRASGALVHQIEGAGAAAALEAAAAALLSHPPGPSAAVPAPHPEVDDQRAGPVLRPQPGGGGGQVLRPQLGGGQVLRLQPGGGGSPAPPLEAGRAAAAGVGAGGGAVGTPLPKCAEWQIRTRPRAQQGAGAARCFPLG
mmetsp:Transcript_2701/g.3468  ORF Transcript_2701/g.3468 Transcript_2701/m.3468 type:complete len:283 (-) Transcript_2701:1020-1868(-)